MSQFSLKTKPDFRDPVPDLVGNNARLSFSDTVRGTSVANSRAVLYDISVIRRYIDEIFPAVRDRHLAHMQANGQQPPANHDWMLSFYWTVKDDRGVPKLSFQVVPVMVIKDPNVAEVFDYFDQQQRVYNHPRANSNDPLNIYDEGHLWP
ncbi:MAG TPA: hypothetical protein VD993_11090 [Chitinophagaceae bacterium]|nr:hypothetical protein [Chitinophagaceae bacterium]